MQLDILYNEDCLLGMQRIPDGSVDMILCDLPYAVTQNHWDSAIPLGVLWAEYRRIIQPCGVAVLTAQLPFSAVLATSNLPWLKGEWIWEKEAGTGFLNAKKYPLRSHENVLVFAPRAHTYNPQMEQGKPYAQTRGRRSENYGPDSKAEIVTINKGSRYPKTVLRFDRDRPKLHPTQKPVALFEYLIRTYTNEGEVVLDNCLGSGTTAIACINTNRHYIGFEKDPGYFQIAQKRIIDHRPQLSLTA